MMDIHESQTIETSRKPNNYLDFLKKALPFLVPLSLMSLLLSYNFHFLALVFPLLSHALERKYMFLICNGILAFLAKTLRYTSSFTITTDTYPPFNITQSFDPDLNLDGEFGKGTHDDDKTNHAQLQHEEEKKIFYVEDEAENRGGVAKALEIQEDEGERGGGVEASQPDEEENDININTEELNRKVEEFIRKMKEEIRIEAKQQLIAV